MSTNICGTILVAISQCFFSCFAGNYDVVSREDLSSEERSRLLTLLRSYDNRKPETLDSIVNKCISDWDTRAITLLRETILDPDRDMRFVSAFVLGVLPTTNPDSQIVERLIENIHAETDSLVRAVQFEILCSSHNTRIIPAISWLLLDSAVVTRSGETNASKSAAFLKEVIDSIQVLEVSTSATRRSSFQYMAKWWRDNNKTVAWDNKKQRFVIRRE